MQRRDFLKLAGTAGLGLISPAIGRAAQPEEDPGIFFVHVQAVGGWEPTLLCDPKGSTNKSYAEDDILTAGKIKYAPKGAAWDTFFKTNASRMVVLNGVDVQSNNHDAGRRHMASGRLGEGHPSAAAVIAGSHAPPLPIALLSFGGYEETGGLVAPTREVDRARLAGIIYPDRLNPDDPKAGNYHSATTRALIDLARRKRAERRLADVQLPKIHGSMDTLLTARLGSDQLKRMEELLPTLTGQGEAARVELAVAAYRAGVGIAANFSRGGFDTHSNHDAAHTDAMSKLLDLVNMIWAKVDAAGVAERTVMLISSDFGRTPTYNGNNGKDHWPISSMIVVSGLPGFQGNRMVGLTDDGHMPILIDPVTLEPSESGVRIRPENIHRNLRDLIGIQPAIEQRYPLSPEVELQLF